MSDLPLVAGTLPEVQSQVSFKQERLRVRVDRHGKRGTWDSWVAPRLGPFRQLAPWCDWHLCAACSSPPLDRRSAPPETQYRRAMQEECEMVRNPVGNTPTPMARRGTPRWTLSNWNTAAGHRIFARLMSRRGLCQQSPLTDLSPASSGTRLRFRPFGRRLIVVGRWCRGRGTVGRRCHCSASWSLPMLNV